MGFKAGDRVVKIDSADLVSPARLQDILADKRPGDPLAVAIRRGAEELLLTPMLAAEPGAARAGGGAGVAVGRGPLTIELWKRPVFRVAVIGIEFPDIKHNAKVSTNDWRRRAPERGHLPRQEERHGRGRPREPERLFPSNSRRAASALRVRSSTGSRSPRNEPNTHPEAERRTSRRSSSKPSASSPLATARMHSRTSTGSCSFMPASRSARNRGAVYSPHAGMIRSFQSKRWPYVLRA